MLLAFGLCTAGSVLFRPAFANKALWPSNGFLVLPLLAAVAPWPTSDRRDHPGGRPGRR